MENEIEKIVGNAIVGRFYNVPCAKLETAEGKITFVPIIGELHNDPQFKVTEDHYHVDGRFLGKTEHYKVDKDGRTHQVVGIGHFYPRFIEVVRKKMLCKRKTTGILIPKETPINREGLKNYNDWAKKMTGKSCKGKKCPHFGTKMHVVNGRLECPLHGLIGDMETEKIIGSVQPKVEVSNPPK